MKRLFVVVNLAMMGSLLVTACSPVGPGKVRVVTDATHPPFEMLDQKTKELQGFDIDLMKAIAADQGLEVEFDRAPLDSALFALSSCQYDAAISSIVITAERRPRMDFSEPYLAAGQIITVNAANTAIHSLDDLKGKKVAAQIGTRGAVEAQQIEGAQVTFFDSLDSAFLALTTSRVDAVIADNPLALGYVARSAARLKTVGSIFTNEVYGIAVCSKNPGLLAAINTGLADIKASGRLDEMTQTWINR